MTNQLIYDFRSQGPTSEVTQLLREFTLERKLRRAIVVVIFLISDTTNFLDLSLAISNRFWNEVCT